MLINYLCVSRGKLNLIDYNLRSVKNLNKTFFILLLSILLIFSVLPGFAAEQVTAKAILEKVDNILNAPQDQKIHIKLFLIGENGIEEESRELVMMQKGEKRMGKFLSPASQRGIGFLSLPNDLFYVYMPAFKKTQRIATRQKSGKFAGTDFSYQDLGTQQYSKEWSSQLLESDQEDYILQLQATEGNSTGYSQLMLWVSKTSFFPVKVEFYDQNKRLCKILTSKNIQEISGYLIARELEMVDVIKNHKTRMFLEKVEFDTGLSDEFFTERYLSR